MAVFCVPCVAHRDPIARKLRLRNRRRDSEDSAGADSVLKGIVYAWSAYNYRNSEIN